MNVKIFSMCIMVIVACILSCVLKKDHKEYSILISVMTGVLIFCMIVSKTTPIINELKDLVKISNIDGDYISILLKSIGICFVTQFASDCCLDAGESVLANKIELAGKISILIVALPLFIKISDVAIKLVNGSF